MLAVRRFFATVASGTLSSRTFSLPILSVRWMSREQRGSGIVGVPSRPAENLQAGFFGFHAQVTDHHVKNTGLHARKGLGGTGGGFDFKSVEFEDCLQRQEHREVVVDYQNAAFHVRLPGKGEFLMRRVASQRRPESIQYSLFSRGACSFSIGACLAST